MYNFIQLIYFLIIFFPIIQNFFSEWKKISSIGMCIMLPLFCTFINIYKNLLKFQKIIHLLDKFRTVVTFRFVFVSGILFPLFAGFFIGGFRNSTKSLVLMDKLGSEYTMSRIYKQTIFTKRKDLSDEMKAEIYLKMNQENQKYEQEVMKNSGLDKL